MSDTKLTNLELVQSELRYATEVIHAHEDEMNRLIKSLRSILNDVVSNVDACPRNKNCTYEIGKDINWINFDMNLISFRIVPDVWIYDDPRCELKYCMYQCEYLPITEDISKINKLIERISNSDISKIIVEYNQCVNDPEYIGAQTDMDRLTKDYLGAIRISEFNRLCTALNPHTGIGMTDIRTDNRLAGYAFVVYRDTNDICYRFVPVDMIKSTDIHELQSKVQNIRIATLGIYEFIKMLYIEDTHAKIYSISSTVNIE